jgi:Zn-dependent M16 (insulinase) family peptidase
MLQGVEPGNTAAVEKLILDKLAELADSGFTAGAIEAAVNTIEFSLRENNTGSFPRGLSLMLRAVGAWIYGRDPYTPIQVRSDVMHQHVKGFYMVCSYGNVADAGMDR